MMELDPPGSCRGSLPTPVRFRILSGTSARKLAAVPLNSGKTILKWPLSYLCRYLWTCSRDPVNFFTSSMTNPFELLKTWLQEERDGGAPNPQQAVLATAAQQTAPHARVVAIREITENGLLFFTQRGTRKVQELQDNPHATMVFWLELQQRGVIVEGSVVPLSAEENGHYWQSYPREAQIRFYSYAPTST